MKKIFLNFFVCIFTMVMAEAKAVENDSAADMEIRVSDAAAL